MLKENKTRDTITVVILNILGFAIGALLFSYCLWSFYMAFTIKIY